MYLLAAKLALFGLLFASASNDDVYTSSQLSGGEQQVWKGLQPSILIISQAGVSRGSAACIDATGLYLAHQNSVRNGPIDGVTFSGQTYPMHLVARDKPTGLVLLQVDGNNVLRVPVIQIAEEEHARQGTLLAVLSTGPVRADIGHPNIVATYRDTNQPLLVNEIRFAAPPQLLTGALLFDDRGNLVGVLGATLPKAQSLARGAARNENLQKYNSGVGQGASQVGSTNSGGQTSGGGNQNQGGQGAGGGGFGGGGGQGPTGGAFGVPLRSVLQGPADLNVAYAVSPLLLNRVVAGFLSPTHDVLHPALGAVCADDIVNNVSQGAVIRKITPGSGAARAGLRVGDIILNIDGTEIHNVVDYARAMLAQSVGHRVTLAVRRGSQTIPLDAVVGRVTDPGQLQQELSQAGR